MCQKIQREPNKQTDSKSPWKKSEIPENLKGGGFKHISQIGSFPISKGEKNKNKENILKHLMPFLEAK